MATLDSVYLDACCFIDVVKTEMNADIEKDRPNEVWFIKRLLQAHRDREINVYTSVITIAECTHVGASPVPKAVQSSFDKLLNSSQYLHLVQTTPFICFDARKLRWEDGINLKGADSIHLQSALEMRSTEFITTDGRFHRISKYSSVLRNKGLSVCRPTESLVLPEKYRQTSVFDEQSTRH